MNAPHDDPLMQALSALPVIRPDAEHATHVRKQCHTVLEQQAQRDRTGFIESTTVSTACAVYAWYILRAVLR
jgi:hypothetical protein